MLKECNQLSFCLSSHASLFDVLIEKDLEANLLEHVSEFLLELGRGFSFVARQKRIDVDGGC